MYELGKMGGGTAGAFLALFGFVLGLIGFELGLFGFVLALFWVCFWGSEGVVYFHNPLLDRSLALFLLLGNWVCFA